MLPLLQILGVNGQQRCSEQDDACQVHGTQADIDPALPQKEARALGKKGFFKDTERLVLAKRLR